MTKMFTTHRAAIMLAVLYATAVLLPITSAMASTTALSPLTLTLSFGSNSLTATWSGNISDHDMTNNEGDEGIATVGVLQSIADSSANYYYFNLISGTANGNDMTGYEPTSLVAPNFNITQLATTPAITTTDGLNGDDLLFALLGSNDQLLLGLPSTAQSGDAVSSTATFNDNSIDTLNMPTGTYKWTYGGASFFILDVQPQSCVPEPSTAPLLLLGLGLICLIGLHRKSSGQNHVA